MKRAALLAGFMLVGLLTFAQVRGVPPSALSMGSGPASSHGFGPPASAMSLGPNGFGNQGRFSYRPQPRFDRDDHRRRPQVAPVYVPYGYYAPYYGYGYTDSSYVAPEPASQPASDGYSNGSAYDAGYSAGARAERDRTADAAADRDRYGSHYLDSRETRSPASDVTVTTGAARETAQPAEREEDQGPATVLIFKNGQQRETRNYAIIGQTLIDITSHAAKKIPLADLDLPATIKANEERGSDFKLPNRG